MYTMLYSNDYTNAAYFIIYLLFYLPLGDSTEYVKRNKLHHFSSVCFSTKIN